MIHKEASKIPLNAGDSMILSQNHAHEITAATAAKIFQISLSAGGTNMNPVIKNVNHNTVFKIDEQLTYEEHKVASMTLAQNSQVGLTLMSFDQGEGISTHAASGDALVQILDGAATITIDKETHILQQGESIVMPAHIPHALKAVERFKMFLVVVK